MFDMFFGPKSSRLLQGKASFIKQDSIIATQHFAIIISIDISTKIYLFVSIKQT